ncbi:MAG TPA: Calx-beta domain-containing protein [Pyrinomonadaceae bacterium]|nr:Calx-beta domain-containing protein [Pyrinomonadaceae bacterium]
MSHYRLMIASLIFPLLVASVSRAQIIRNQTPEVSLSAHESHAITAPGGATASLIPFSVGSQGSTGDIFDVNSQNAAAIVTLVLPNGLEINATNAVAMGFTYEVVPNGSFANSFFLNFLSSAGTHTMIQLPVNANPGTYQIKINTSQLRSNTLVIATYISSSSLRANVLTDSPTYHLGETVVLSGLVFEGSAPVANATVTAKIGDPSDSVTAPVQSALSDSGTFDGAPSDGIYTGTFTANRAGVFTVAMQATGNSQLGVSFSRSASTSFRVLPPLADFVSFADSGVDDNANGLFDRIVVTTNLNVQRAGNYQFSLNLEASNGSTATGRGSASLATGSGQLKISFAANDIRALAVNGPYTLKDAILTFQDDPDKPVIDYRANAGNTSAYMLSGLEHATILFTGTNTAVGVDTNSNGKFELLRLQTSVQVGSTGSYSWSGSLVDLFGREIDFSSGSAMLTAGANSIIFNFSGTKIGQNGADGPYTLQSVLLFGSGQSIVVNKLFTTQAFSVTEFENALLKADLATAISSFPEPVAPGSNITYTITLTNNGPSTAENMIVTDNLPTGTVFVSCSANGGGVCGGSGNNRTVTFPRLAGGAVANVTLVARAECIGGGNTVVNNTASVTSNISDPSPGNNSIGATTTVLNQALQFSSINNSVSEGNGSATLTVSRICDTSGIAKVNYSTSDGTGKQRTDYITSAGTLTFAPGESSKSITVLLVDNAYIDGNRTVNIDLTSPTGAALGTPASVVLNIQDNDTSSPTTNPLDNSDARFFVRQHYYDFLSRVPDQAGFDYWASQMTQCGSDTSCLRIKRNDVSNAFFFEPEYQQTAAYVFRLFRAAFGNSQPFPNPDDSNRTEARKIPSYAAFSTDRARLIGSAHLAQDQLALANAFVQRPEFLSKYPSSLTGPQFVDALLANINNDIGADLTSERDGLVLQYNQGGTGMVLYRTADDNGQTIPINNRSFIDNEYNRVFIASQYFGYLRRDSDIAGFLFWLGQINSSPLRDVAKQHAIVCSLITSAEYQQRFSLVVTHSNAECPH